MLACCALLGLSACIYRMPIQQGNFLEKKQVDQLETGMTRSQVMFLLGTPMVPNGFDKDRWDYYYYAKFSKRYAADTLRLTVYFKDDKVDHIDKPKEPEAPPVTASRKPRPCWRRRKNRIRCPPNSRHCRRCLRNPRFRACLRPPASLPGEPLRSAPFECSARGRRMHRPVSLPSARPAALLPIPPARSWVRNPAPGTPGIPSPVRCLAGRPAPASRGPAGS